MELSKYLSGGRLQRLALKELRESLRDRRTVITLLLMPVLVYPLLGMVLQRLLLSASKEKAGESYVIGIAERDVATEIDRMLYEAQTLINSGGNTLIAPREWTEAPPNASASENSVPENSLAENSVPKFDLVLVQDVNLDQALDRGSIDIAISQLAAEPPQDRDQPLAPHAIDRGREASPMQRFQVEMKFRRGDARSEEAGAMLRRMCQLINDQQLRFALRSLDPRLAPAVELKSIGIGKPLDPAASIAAVIPLVLILMTITGAVYPAIDLTAGERERGTMEAMIATPAPRFALLLSKYFAVVTVSILTALANLFATWMTLSFGGLGAAIFGEGGFRVGTLLQILPILMIFAAFFSSILLALCSFAKTFKEAQAYLIPVMLVSLAPGLVTLMPDIELTTTLAVVPLLNVLLLSRDIMTGVPPLVPAIIAIVTTVAYGAAALVIASHLFGAANSMTSNQATWNDLLRGTSRRSDAPDIGSLAIYLAFLFPVLFIVSSMGGMLAGRTQLLMGLNAVSLLVLFLLLPMLWVRFRRASVKQTFLLGGMGADTRKGRSIPSPVRITLTLLGVLMLASTLWVFALEGVLLFKSWSLSSLVPDLDKIKKSWLEIPFAWILLTQAAAPAIAEEFFFRGYVLSALRTKLRSAAAVLLSALLFGWFHAITGNMLSLEKFLPTLGLGLVLGFLAVWTRSIWFGVLLHACHNGLVLWFSRLEKETLEPWFGQGDHMPIQLLILAGIGLIAGGALIWVANRGNQSKAEI